MLAPMPLSRLALSPVLGGPVTFDASGMEWFLFLGVIVLAATTPGGVLLGTIAAVVGGRSRSSRAGWFIGAYLTGVALQVGALYLYVFGLPRRG